MRRTWKFPTEESLTDKCPSCEKLIRPADIVRLTMDYSRCPHCGTAYATVDIWGKSRTDANKGTQSEEVAIMPVKSDALLSLWDMENMPACDEGIELARRFLEAAGECVNTWGPARTSTSRADLLWTYNAMVIHSDKCDKCNEV